MTPRKASDKGPRLHRLPEARYYEEEITLVRKVVGTGSISDFIRTAVMDKARREDASRNPKTKTKK